MQWLNQTSPSWSSDNFLTKPFYKKIGFKIGDFPAAEQYYKEAISIPMFYGLQEEDQNYVILTLREVLDS